MKVLVVGGQSREHALAWKIAQSPLLTKLYIAPGNPGTASIAENIPYSKIPDIIAWLRTNPVDLVVIGPDNYLADGLVDEVQKLGIRAFGPTQAAAQVEWSKRYAKELMQEAGIPTATFRSFDNLSSARAYVETLVPPVVIKASGLAYGKGVVIAQSIEEANQVLSDVMEKKIFGDAGNEVVIEEYLHGREISIHAMCDGTHALLFPSSQDHKQVFDGDKGPNTGGMGTVAPLPWITDKDMADIKARIVEPLLKALRKRGTPFRGLLYPGLMMTAEGPKVIEFNARFGQPETETYMRLFESDLLEALDACARGDLTGISLTWKPGAACCVIAASKGYPGDVEKGKEIQGLGSLTDQDIVVFHVGTKQDGDRLVTNGGRVLGITATGENLRTALKKAYEALGQVSFDGMQYRRDIGAKSLTP